MPVLAIPPDTQCRQLRTDHDFRSFDAVQSRQATPPRNRAEATAVPPQESQADRLVAGRQLLASLAPAPLLSSPYPHDICTTPWGG